MIRYSIPSRQKRVVVDIDTQRCFFGDMAGNFTGPDGKTDCIVDSWDIAFLAADWLRGGTIFGFDGTLVDGPQWQPTSGHVNGALDFDGIDDYVSIPKLYLYSNTITMSAWIKPDGDQNMRAGIIFCRDEEGSKYHTPLATVAGSARMGGPLRRVSAISGCWASS